MRKLQPIQRVFQISHMNRYMWPTKAPKIRRSVTILFTFDCHEQKYRNRNINP